MAARSSWATSARTDSRREGLSACSPNGTASTSGRKPSCAAESAEVSPAMRHFSMAFVSVSFEALTAWNARSVCSAVTRACQ